MLTKLGTAALLLISLVACSTGQQRKADPTATTTSTMAGRGGVNAGPNRTDSSTTSTTDGAPGRGGVTGAGGAPQTTAPGVTTPSTSGSPYLKR
jgi:hypothetical protein